MRSLDRQVLATGPGGHQKLVPLRPEMSGNFYHRKYLSRI